jgi:large subunit ribosomal protein L32e
MAKNIKKTDEPKQTKEAENTADSTQKESKKEKVTSKSTSEKNIKKTTKTNTKTKAKAVKPVAKKKQAKVKKTKAPVKKKDAKDTKVSKKAKKDIEKKETDDEESDDEDVEIVDEELEDEDEEEEQYIVKQKPELTPEMKRKLRLRKVAKKKKPKFKRQEWFRYKKLNDSWRKPRGLHSKLRTNRKYRINKVRIGYGTTADVRGLHASGFKEILVYNKSDLEKLDPKLEAARIGHSVGTRKRIEIEEYADELGIRILNRGS